MGTLLHFPAASSAGHDPHLQALAEAVSGFVCQLGSFQKVAEGSLLVALARIEAALADIDKIGRQLPSGEFKTQIDLDLATLVAQLDQAKTRLAGLGSHGYGETLS
jgi:hypothetical protein